MALPGNHTINTSYASSYSPSVGATPVACYFPIPYRARVLQLLVVTAGAITTADSTITVSVNGTSVGTFPITLAGAGAGVVTTYTPASPLYVSSGDVVTCTPSGASGSSIAANFQLTFRRA